jgi:hypothetical protein
MDNSCVVVIPIHASSPSGFELISFQQCFKILGSHPIRVVAPMKLDLSIYRRLVPDFKVVYVDPKWQANLLSYNRFKLSNYFYECFSEFTYLLTYELDAFVFKDELTNWCNLGYDYIGAPWFDGYVESDSDVLIGVGNSGFSLRNIQTLRKILSNFYYYDPEIYYGDRFKRLKARVLHPFRWLNNLGRENESIQSANNLFEDAFISHYVKSKYDDFKLAPVDIALKFSFEVKPEVLYKFNNNTLPMGCHAWWRYNLNFWKPYIESYGYDLEADFKIK